MRVAKLGLLLILGAVLAGCSDPATEAPVSPKPGLYRLTMDRTALGPAKIAYDPNKVEEKCVADQNDLDWIYPMIQRKFCPECSCSTTDKTRTGNAIAARTVCPFDDSGTFGAFEYAYRGVVSDVGVSLTGNIKSGLSSYVAPDATEAEKAEAAAIAEDVESVVMTGKIERIGDCPA